MEIVFAKPNGQVQPDFFEGETTDLACPITSRAYLRAAKAE